MSADVVGILLDGGRDADVSERSAVETTRHSLLDPRQDKLKQLQALTTPRVQGPEKH